MRIIFYLCTCTAQIDIYIAKPNPLFMSKFQDLLSANQLVRHSGQAIWRYGLSDNAFQQLKKMLIETRRINDLDSRDCLLYYAEWWKRCYNGGYPSKKEVFASISSGQYYNEDDFYKSAKKGAALLGIRWIKRQNTQYFKTLLFQGGLPIKHIATNKGAYKDLLLKILELNPTTIDDFAFNSDITNLLPPSGRNDEIYDCCLAIVSAIINEDQDYLSILDKNNELREITGELRTKKRTLTFEKKKSGFKSYWVLEPEEQRIRLYLGLTDMSGEKFRSLFGIEDDLTLDFEYKLFYNGGFLCKFTKRTDEVMRVKWVGDHELIWDKADQLPDLYLVGSSGLKHESQHLITYFPRLDKPTLWRKYSEKQWILEKGLHTSADEGLALYPLDILNPQGANSKKMVVNGIEFNWCLFIGNFTLSKLSERWDLKTGQHKIDWIIDDHKPSWMIRANYTVVRGKPKIIVYDEKENVLSRCVLKWKPKGGGYWHDWNMTMTPGLLEVMIIAGPVTEYDTIFNIGQLNLKVTSNSLQEAIAEVSANSFLFSINNGINCNAEKVSNDKYKLSLVNNSVIPLAIQGTLRHATQSSGLRFEMLPPFKGVEIIDNDNSVVPETTPLSLTRLNGMRLMSNQKQLRVNMWNTSRSGMIASVSLQEPFIPLRTFSDKMFHLYALSDTMDGTAEIKFEIVEERPSGTVKIKEYSIKRYDVTLQVVFNEKLEVNITSSDPTTELLAVPLDCTSEELSLRALDLEEGHWRFSELENIEKFVVFGVSGPMKTQPIFISRDPYNVPTSEEDRQKRVLTLKDELLDNGYDSDVWQRLLSYYRICLNHDLPYSTFDILRATTFSSLLAAKVFVFLTVYDSKDVFTEVACGDLENDLGFSFHWISGDNWGAALEWMGSGLGMSLIHDLGASLKIYLEMQQPFVEFAKTTTYILQASKPSLAIGFHLNTRIMQLRTSLGGKVLKELPQKYPRVPDNYQVIIPVTEQTAKVEMLLRAPLVVALSIAGKDEALWHEDNEFRRRNIRYAQQLNPEWYAEALNYCLTKI